jgi:hypothetical protein
MHINFGGCGTQVLSCFFPSSAAGLAVDWINDKIYWVDGDYDAIYKYDLITRETKKVRDLSNSIPLKLKIFPQANDSR